MTGPTAISHPPEVMAESISPDLIDQTNRVAYDAIAAEYDHDSHATCRDFDFANHALLRQLAPFVKHWRERRGAISVLEVGPGPSQLFDQIAGGFGLHADRYWAIDISSEMADITELRYRGRIKRVHQLSIHAAHPSKIDQHDLLICLLADPYLTSSAISRMKNLLKPGGLLVITLPNHSWARSVRGGNVHTALFHDTHGHQHPSFSFCWPPSYLKRICAAENLRLREHRSVLLDAVPNPSRVNMHALAKLRNQPRLLEGYIFERV